ncbi:MAG: SprT family zinc-dependent metalloprotease [Clostridium sp.]|uniref:M48 family metallopeptidase n=1 Tax=Clostridium sp. TaxID=1506 RepID=UPI0039EA56A1
MILKFIYAGKEIEFEVVFSKRKTMEISIAPSREIKVRAPLGIPKAVIRERVMEKAPWIVKKLYQFRNVKNEPLIREFINGEVVMYLGVDYQLQIDIKSHINKAKVNLLNDKIVVTINNENKENIRKTMELWYREKVKEEIDKRINFYQKFFIMTPSEVKVKEQKKRWGSCTYKDALLFNWRCVMAKSEVLDYIVVHEMCHMVHKNHSKEYWKLVAFILPDYRQREQWLKNNGYKFFIIAP